MMRTVTSTRRMNASSSFHSTALNSMGVEVKTTEPGIGITKPKKGQKCTMHYRGKLTDGTEFDSSYKRNKPFTFTLGVGQVIRGWDEGVTQMTKGECATLTMTPDFGYGARGAGRDIPPNASLVFDVELIDFN